MELNLHPERKIVEVWLTNAEKDDESLRERLKPLYQEYKKQGYLVATFQSGDEELADLTGALLTANRRRMAKHMAHRNDQKTKGLVR